jgi:UDP-N-acetylmuramoyl-tripeptide--D-alanyl-D-alanine ligase
VISAVHGGDALMVKGSAGSRMGPIVKALAKRYSRDAVAGQDK